MSTAPLNTDNLGPLIWVLCHNEAARDEELLKAEVVRLHHFKATTDRTALINALCSGIVFLRQEASSNARHARNSGLLLFCWPGTKVLEGSAA